MSLCDLLLNCSLAANMSQFKEKYLIFFFDEVLSGLECTPLM